MGLGSGYTGSAAQNKNMITWMKNNGYQTGIRRIPEDEYAWTQENGAEAIVRQSDGAVWTSLKAGDAVLNAGATQNLWDMANNPAEFIASYAGGNVRFCDVATGGEINNDISL